MNCGGRGRIWLPQVEAPLAQNSAIPRADDIQALLRGARNSFNAEKLRALYGDKPTFMARFNAAAERAVAAGVLMPRDVAQLLVEANASWRV